MQPHLVSALLLAFAAVAAGCVQLEPDVRDAPPPTATTAPTPGASPYAGEEARTIKALSPQEVDDLRAGRGMGYAKAAELNSWPGPAHVLELADALELTDEQRAAVERVREDMLARAVPLGHALVRAEAALDEAFAEGHVDSARLRELTAEAARVEGELRFVHLDAHLATRALLDAEQVRAYDTLRGYDAREEPSNGHAHGGH